jgi:hypothetical protein
MFHFVISLILYFEKFFATAGNSYTAPTLGALRLITSKGLFNQHVIATLLLL